MDSVIENVRDKLDIVDVVGSYLKLEKTGINFRACCPFHSEKKPSFFVSPARQSWRCFGCSVGGSVFDFVMQIEGIEFGDALKLLAKRAGIELQTFTPEMKTARTRLYEICELGCKFFEKQLTASEGKKVKKYLLERGLTKESIEKWRIGYAPDQWRALSDFLVSRGYKREEIVKAGLATESDKAKAAYDRFRGRIIFPIFDLNSQVIGFGARIKQGVEDTAKYINTPNTVLYDKSNVVYGLNFGKVEVRRKDYAVVTEGYMDVIMAHQAGFENTVASSGTALTNNQLRILKRYTPNLYTAFDMDVAGDIATKKGIDLAQKQDFNIRVITMPEGKDPADVIAEDPEKWKKTVAQAVDIFTFYFESAFSKYDKTTPEGKKEISKLLLPRIKDIPNKIVQAHWIQKLAGSIKTAEDAVLDEMKKIVNRREEKHAVDKKPEQKSRRDILEQRIVCLAFNNPERLELLEDLSIFSPDIKEILICFKKDRDVKKVLEKMEKKGDNVKKVVDDIMLMADIQDFGAEHGEIIEDEIGLCLEELNKLDLKTKLKNLSAEIKQAEEEKDQKKLKSLIEEFNKITKQL